MTFEHVFNATRECIFLWIFIISTLVLTSRYRRFLPDVFKGLVAASALAALAMLAQDALSAHSVEQLTRRMGGFGRGDNPILAALIFSVALLAAFALASDRDRPIRLRVLWATAVIPLVAAIALTQSRGPWIALYASMLLGAAVARRWIVCVGLVAFAALATALVVAPDVAGDLRFVERGMASRPVLWQQTLERALEAPVVGLGWGTDLGLENVSGRYEKSPHNVYLSVFAYTGVVGLTLFLVVIGYALRCAWTDVQRGSPRIASLVLVLGLVANVFDGYFPIQNLGVEWLILWLPVAALIGEGTRETLPSPGAEQR